MCFLTFIELMALFRPFCEGVWAAAAQKPFKNPINSICEVHTQNSDIFLSFCDKKALMCEQDYTNCLPVYSLFKNSTFYSFTYASDILINQKRNMKCL